MNATASRRGVYVCTAVVADPDADPRDIFGAIAEAAEKAQDRFRPPVSADQLVLFPGL